MNCVQLFKSARLLKPPGEPRVKHRGLDSLVCIPYSPNVTNPMKLLDAPLR